MTAEHPDQSHAGIAPVAEAEAGAGPVDRRRLVLTAAGLLLPAAPVILLPGAAEGGRNRRRGRKRRNHRPVGGWLADDTVVNLINQTGAEWDVTLKTSFSFETAYSSRLGSGRESGWNPGVPVDEFGGAVEVWFSWPESGGAVNHRFHLTARNPEVGTPWITLYAAGNGKRWIIFDQDLSAGQSAQKTHEGLKVIVHRWSNGKETIGGETESYCRFVVRVHHA
ncbi:MAG: hypothetical protein ACKOWF_06350 [Chloroflexota bacterium]